MRKLKRVAEIVGYNGKALTGFEVLYKLASVLLFAPLLLGAFRLAMRLAGYSYLTLENLLPFLGRPVTLLLLAVILLLAAVYAMVDVSAVLFALDCAVQKKRVTCRQIVRFAAKNAVRVCHRKNVLLVPVVLLLLPFVHIGLASGFLTSISIPEFILDYIRANRVLSALFVLLAVALTVLVSRWLYAFFYFTLEGCSFADARRKSVALSRGKRLRDFAEFLLLQLGMAVVCVAFLLLLTAAASLVGKLLSGVFLLRWIGSTAVWLAVVLALAIFAASGVPLGYGCVGFLYYRRKAEIGEAVRHVEVPELPEHPRRRTLYKGLRVTFCCLLAAGSLTLGFLLSTGKISPDIAYLRTVEITAHRGASAYYPENTLPAFEGAKKLGADWVELDVQQSKDGKIFVAHDTNFKRTAGVNADSWELTYDEIAKLDVGRFFSEDYAGTHMPLLSDVIAFARENDMKLNIELKPTGHETNFEAAVVAEIRRANFADDCVITSQVYEVLERVKACDDGIPTVYVMSLAYGDINRLTAADHFSVEAMNVSKSLVSEVHKAGKQLYAWTVNTKESITKMVERGVDNIITDDVELARACIDDSRYSTLLQEFIKLLQ